MVNDIAFFLFLILTLASFVQPGKIKKCCLFTIFYYLLLSFTAVCPSNCHPIFHTFAAH